MQMRLISLPRLIAIVCGLVCMTFANRAGAFPPTCPETTGSDVITGEIANSPTNTPHITNYTSAGGIEAVSISTVSCNVGTAWVNWIANDNRHPVIAQNVYRLKNVNGSNRLEHLGQSWLKHGFLAFAEDACCDNCDGTGGSHLGVGCSDPYNSSRNGGQTNAGPKWQVNATTGVFTYPPANPSFTGTVARRCQIKTTDLENSDGTGPTKYFIEGQYVTQDDAAAGNKNNNASHRRLLVTGAGTAWTFSVSAAFATLRQSPAIQAWVFNDTGVTLTSIDTPEDFNLDPDLTVARVYLAAKATDLGGGIYHYEYAIQNLNSDRSIGTFSVPVSPYANVTNIGFHDVDYHSGDGIGSVNRDGTDWPGAHSGGAVSWATIPFATNQNSNAIRWATLYNFRFDCDVAPTTGNATLGQYKTVNNLPASTVIPSTVTCIPGDMNNDGLVDGFDIDVFTQRVIGGTATPRENCAGDRGAVPDGKIRLDDVDGFAGCVLNSGC